ncbi:hypothetical protein [Xanthomarina spongicola]|uniref:Magnesium citrate secondary transporter n=1 Tax=Xanthomarina spongicola TaxID=570520 RepID=A0A316DRY9_9FLAO|nr:hypothetical protein [Xanthomarina spongicola]PWK20774.1 hypothetical protein LX78_00477 [Xanthomarina spongicola]
MKILKNPIFLVFCLIALFIYFASRLALPLPSWIYSYVNDFLCMPIVLSLSLAILRFIKKTDAIYAPLSIILIMTTYYAIYFEWLMPKLNTRYTGDPIDVFLYFLGAILFYIFQKRLL